jgi:hypothetical protein
MPAPGSLEGRELPVVADPFSSQVTWSVTLPRDGCPPASGQEQTVENDLGSFRQSFKLDGRKLVLERRSELRRRWIEGGEGLGRGAGYTMRGVRDDPLEENLLIR